MDITLLMRKQCKIRERGGKTMSNYTYYVLLVLLFLAIAIYNMYRLKKKRDELRYYYDKKEKHRKIKIGSSHQMKKIIGEPGGGREYDFTDFPKSKEEVEKIAEKSISENPFSDKIKCLTKHYFTRLPLFNELIWPLMLKKVKDLPIYENGEELQEALEEIKDTFGDDFEIIQNATLINLMSFFDEMRKFHTRYGLSPEEYYQEILKKLKW